MLSGDKSRWHILLARCRFHSVCTALIVLDATEHVVEAQVQIASMADHQVVDSIHKLPQEALEQAHALTSDISETTCSIHASFAGDV